jgi:hypothetical protein
MSLEHSRFSSVVQMSILEAESSATGSTPQGVVLGKDATQPAYISTDFVFLALIAPEPISGKESETLRVLRMYNLSSLCSLARWATSQRNTKPLDLRKPSDGNPTQPTPPKKHKHNASFVSRGIKALVDNSNPDPFLEPRTAVYHHANLDIASGRRPSASAPRPTPDRQQSGSSVDSSWDVVDDLPLRWATDYVPLAAAGSRLLNLSVISYALLRDERSRGRGGALLAVATKSSILLYETPKGERAFRFMKVERTNSTR